jgi:Lrp/AsnC family leucine-responsive transcriptional regulator
MDDRRPGGHRGGVTLFAARANPLASAAEPYGLFASWPVLCPDVETLARFFVTLTAEVADPGSASRRPATSGGGGGHPVQPDPADLRLLALLREEGRLSVSELAERAHVSRATAYLRLQRLQEAGILHGYSARVSARGLGLGVTAVVLLSVRQPDWRKVEEQLRHFPEVEYFAFITGTYDAILIVRTPDIDTLRDVVLERLQAVPEIRSTQTSFVLEEVIHRPYVLPARP